MTTKSYRNKSVSYRETSDHTRNSRYLTGFNGSGNPTNYSKVYFSDEDHRENFQICIQKFVCRSKEYISSCYLAAYPEIFKCFELEQQDNGPFNWYFNCLENDSLKEHRSTGSTAPLTGQTTALVHLGLNLWNGHSFDLASGLAIWDSELYTVVLQAINLRREVLNP